MARALLLLLLGACAPVHRPVVVLVSAGAEWRALRALHPGVVTADTPFGETFSATVRSAHGPVPVVYLHGGWGKIAAAGSAQYAIDRWRPHTLVNLGTAGGFAGQVERLAILLVRRTVVYDIVERMGDPAEALAAYATDLDLSWLGAARCLATMPAVLASADQDLDPAALQALAQAHGAVAADWESGAIAWVAGRNHVRVLILRGVSDLVGPGGGEAYGHEEVFVDGAAVIMKKLDESLGCWLEGE